MSDVFLTKVERKTILTQSFAFVIIMFVISDLMITGPFWFKLLPWLYFLGLISKSKLSKSVITLLIVSFTTFISCILKTGGVNIEVLVLTLNSIFMVVLGIFTGTCLKELKLGQNLVKFIPKTKKVYMIIISIFLTVIAILVNFVINGNVFDYIKSRTSINSYLSSNYDINKYEILDIKYNLVNFKSQYIYNVKCDNTILMLKFTNNSFEDANYKERKQEVLNIFRTNITSYLNEKLRGNEYINTNNISYDLGYELKSVLPNKLNVYISKGISNDEKVYQEMISVINTIQNYEEIKKYKVEYIITYGKNVTNVTEDNVPNLTVQYLKNSFKINEIF